MIFVLFRVWSRQVVLYFTNLILKKRRYVLKKGLINLNITEIQKKNTKILLASLRRSEISVRTFNIVGESDEYTYITYIFKKGEIENCTVSLSAIY